MDETRNLL